MRNNKYMHLVNSTHLSVFWPIIEKKGQRHDSTIKFAWFSCAWGMHHNMRRFRQCITLLPGNPFSFILLLLLLLLHKGIEYYKKEMVLHKLHKLSYICKIIWLKYASCSFYSYILNPLLSFSSPTGNLLNCSRNSTKKLSFMEPYQSAAYIFPLAKQVTKLTKQSHSAALNISYLLWNLT